MNCTYLQSITWIQVIYCILKQRTSILMKKKKTNWPAVRYVLMVAYTSSVVIWEPLKVKLLPKTLTLEEKRKHLKSSRRLRIHTSEPTNFSTAVYTHIFLYDWHDALSVSFDLIVSLFRNFKYSFSLRLNHRSISVSLSLVNARGQTQGRMVLLTSSGTSSCKKK